MAEPPAFSGRFEEGERALARLDPLMRAPREVPGLSQDIVGLAHRGLIAGAPGFRDGHLGALRALLLVAEVGLDLGEPEVEQPREARILQPCDLLSLGQEKIEDLGETPQEVDGADEPESQFHAGAVPGFGG